MVDQRLHTHRAAAARWHDHVYGDLRRLPPWQRDFERAATQFAPDQKFRLQCQALRGQLWRVLQRPLPAPVRRPALDAMGARYLDALQEDAP